MQRLDTHDGENIRLLRTIRRLNQKELARLMGSEWNQQKVAYWEKQPVVKTTFLQKFAAAMSVPPYILKKPREQLSHILIQSTKPLNRKINELYYRLVISEAELLLLKQRGKQSPKEEYYF